MAEEEEEYIFIVPLRITKSVPRTKRSPRAIKAIREYMKKHMRVEEKDVWIDPEVNEEIWKRGIQHPPKKIRVKALLLEEGEVEVSLPED
ncbi:MAG: 50S ribosomal protein L31e [Methanomassiliicoccales archaeon]|nr:MAG: 50S ribosomal protein L31e [Methanomassiliicoccales archaeon]